MVWYTGDDLTTYNEGDKFVPLQRFTLPYERSVPVEEEETITQSYGIPNTNAFTNRASSGPTPVFSPYTAQPRGSFVTNRTSFGNTGYIQGTEPEETYMDKIGGLVKSGIGMAIPGGNFLMGMLENQNRNNRLSAADNAFIDMQLANQEQSMHGGNLTNQDRYGYNKVSFLGNYAELVAKHAAKAKNKNPEDLTDFDKYYMEKAKEQENIDDQIEFNNWANQKYIANKIRDLQAKGIDPYPDGTDIHGGDDTTTGGATTVAPQHHGDVSINRGDHQAKGFRSEKAEGIDTKGSGMHGGKHYAIGGRVGLNYGGLASMLGRVGLNYGGNPNEERSHSLAGTHVGENAARADGPDNKDRKKLTISPVIDTKWTDLGFEYPTGVFGFDALTPFGKLKATANLKNYVTGDDVDPTLDYQGNIGPVDINATYSDDVQNINATINNNNWNAGINYDAITGEPTFGINYSKTFKHGGLARLL